MVEINCSNCGIETKKHAYRLKVYKNLYCSLICKREAQKKYRHTKEAKRKITQALLGSKRALGSKHPMSEEHKQNIRDNPRDQWFKKGQTPWNKGIEWLEMRGEKHPQWKGGVAGAKRKNERNDPAYRSWMTTIKRRDKKCQLKDNKCEGYLVVHHILPWSKYPEERYNINNGITLCQFHHPLKRFEEQRLIPVFQELVGSK